MLGYFKDQKKKQQKLHPKQENRIEDIRDKLSISLILSALSRFQISSRKMLTD